MANKINSLPNTIFQFTELTPKEYETMPENGLYLLRCKLPEYDWASSCKEDMKDALSKQIRHYGIGNWGKDAGFHIYSVAVSDNIKEADEVSPLFFLHLLYCGEGRISIEKERLEIASHKQPEGNLKVENCHYPLQNKNHIYLPYNASSQSSLNTCKVL